LVADPETMTVAAARSPHCRWRFLTLQQPVASTSPQAVCPKRFGLPPQALEPIGCQPLHLALVAAAGRDRLRIEWPPTRPLQRLARSINNDGGQIVY
jgi:hypothetical protein